MVRMYFLTLAVVLLLSGCANSSVKTTYAGQSGLTAGRLTPYQHTLAAQLFEQQQGLQRVAVSSFVPVDRLMQSQDKYTRMARQLQEGLISEATLYNIGVIEYRLTQQLQLNQQQERALSRNPEQLREHYRLDYIVVGTYSEVEGGILINARLVNSRNATVMSAASVMVPWHTIESTPATSEWRHGGLYRQTVKEG